MGEVQLAHPLANFEVKQLLVCYSAGWVVLAHCALISIYLMSPGAEGLPMVICIALLNVYLNIWPIF